MELQEKKVVAGVDQNEQPGPQAITDGVHHSAISEDTPSVPTTLCAERGDQTQKQQNSMVFSPDPLCLYPISKNKVATYNQHIL